MALQVLINSVDMSAYVAPKSLKIDMDTSHWKTCSLTLNNIAINEGVPEEGKKLTVNWIEAGHPDMMLFKGVINKKQIKQLAPASNKLNVQLTSDGFRNIPYRRTVTEYYSIIDPATYITAKEIIISLINVYLAYEGITYYDIGILEGKHYEDDIEFVCMSIGEILDKLASDSNANWYINANQELYFVAEYYSFDGPSGNDIDIDNPITIDVRNLELKTDLNNYANKVFFKGDIDPTDITAYDNIQVVKFDQDEINHMSLLDGGSGVYGITVSNPEIKTQEEAETYCQKILDKRKVKPKSITFDTFNWKEYQVGQRQNVNIPIIGVSNTALKPKNYVVESISLTDLGNGKLTKKIDMRQLFSDVSSGTGAVTWQKGSQGVAFFAKLTELSKAAETKAKDMIKNHVYVENLRGEVLSTQNFEGNGNYIRLEREFETWWDATAPSAPKMAIGFIKDKNNITIPGIVFGAGDGAGNNRGYITKGTTGLDMFYITPTGGVARIRLGNDGKVYLNETEIQAFSESSQIPSTYIEAADDWNAKLQGMKYDGTTGEYYYADKVIKDGNANNYIKLGGTFCDFQLWDRGFSTNTPWIAIQQVYQDSNIGSLNIWDTYGNPHVTMFLDVYGGDGRVRPRGLWDFSDATNVTGVKAEFA